MGCSVEVNVVELVPLEGSLDSYFFCNNGVLGSLECVPEKRSGNNTSPTVDGCLEDEDGWEDMEEYVGLNEGEAVSSERKETVDLEVKGIVKGEPPQQDNTRAKQHHKGSKRERTLFSIVNQIWPSVDQKIFDKIMNEDISDQEVEPYLSLVADMFLYADVRARWNPCVDWRMSRICDDITMRQSPYGEKFRRSFRRRWGETRRKGLRRITKWTEQHKTISLVSGGLGGVMMADSRWTDRRADWIFPMSFLTLIFAFFSSYMHSVIFLIVGSWTLFADISAMDLLT
jgi:hypothetical protein